MAAIVAMAMAMAMQTSVAMATGARARPHAVATRHEERTMSGANVERSLRMVPERSVLVLVDFQEKLMPAMHEGERVLARARLVTQAASLLGVPAIATAQNPSRLGDNDPQLASACGTVLDKMHFGACEGGLTRELDRLDAERADGTRAQVVIAGCEAHVCLLQTALGLLEEGRTVWALADGSGSRRPSDHEVAMARLIAAGAHVVTSEMVVFEWLDSCENEQFKAVSALVKATPLD